MAEENIKGIVHVYVEEEDICNKEENEQIDRPTKKQKCDLSKKSLIDCKNYEELKHKKKDMSIQEESEDIGTFSICNDGSLFEDSGISITSHSIFSEDKEYDLFGNQDILAPSSSALHECTSNDINPMKNNLERTQGDNQGSDKKLHKCDTCSYSTTNKSTLRSHERAHSGVKPYKCYICLKSFLTSHRLTQHKRTHTGEKPFKCDICLAFFSQTSSLNQHKRIHTGEKPYKCDICLQTFYRKQHLLQHNSTHNGEKPYKCDLCLASFTRKFSLFQHNKWHAGEKPYQCDICLQFFSRSTNLKVHKRTHTGEKPYKCEVCLLSFSLKRNLDKHKTIH